MRTCVIFNPSARGGRARALAAWLRSVGAGMELRPTTGPGVASELAREAVREGYEIIGAAGGDGTIYEVLNGIADEPGGFERSRLGIIPLGTANVLAHELHLPADPRAALEILRRGRARTVDCATAEFTDDSGGRRTAHFAVVAGAGLDARAVHSVNLRLKKRVGKLAYIAAALGAAFRHRDCVRCRIGGVVFEGRAVLAGNGRLYAGAIPVFNDGSLDSGLLHVRGVRELSVSLLLHCAQAYVTGRWYPGRQLASDRVTTLELESDQPTPLQLDGEWVGWLPARLHIRPRSMQVIVP
ncbi:MAG: diacylglycerol kinase family lipid kinase [Verrucomicrobiales bacterium]|nr:diacylglycerol kinase family lipid kinase [Verrucomicrobiales bacterium]